MESRLSDLLNENAGAGFQKAFLKRCKASNVWTYLLEIPLSKMSDVNPVIFLVDTDLKIN